MKKRNIIIVIILFVISFASFIFSLVKILYPDVKDNYLTLNSLSSIMEKYNCKVIEKGNNNYYYETTDNCIFNLHYIIFDDEKTRNKFFNDFIENVNDNDNITGENNIDINIGILLIGKETYGDHFKSVLIKNNSLLYLDTLKDNRIEAINLKKELGFYYEPNWKNFKYLIIPLITFIICIIYFVYVILINKKIKVSG